MARPTKLETENRRLSDELNRISAVNRNLLDNERRMRAICDERVYAAHALDARLNTAREIITDQAQQIANLRRELAVYRAAAYTLYDPLASAVGIVAPSGSDANRNR
jgi:chromosome segregation ATPase